MSDTAIVVLAIGEEYLAYWRQYCEHSCRAYAGKFNYDLIVVREPLDASPRAQARSAAWQKCLVLSQDFSARYRRIISLDCDIAINFQEAPSITDQVPFDRVGGVISGSHVHEDMRCLLRDRLLRNRSDYSRGLRTWEALQRAAYVHAGLQPLPSVIQTGVLVANPTHHRGIFESIYYSQEHEQHMSRCYEQIPLSHALLTKDMFCPIDTRFNSVFYETALVHYPYLTDERLPNYDFAASCAVQTELANNFFLHFAYDRTLARYLPQSQPLSGAGG